MANDGQIVFEVTADGKHAIADIKDITRAIQDETKKWDKAADQSAGNINDSFSGMLKKLVAGFSAAKIGKALLDLGKDALEAASDLKEVQNVVDTTFGSNAGQIDRWAKNAGTQFGLTETKAKQFTSTLGAMMKSSGIAGDEIVSMSTDLAGLAADMSSFYNLDFDTAFQKIRSGISGETEPLKQLGINMSVANLEAYALSQGIEKAFSDMSQGEQTMLRYQYLMSATADAQGDFAKTSTEYANSMRTLKSNVEAIKTALGSTFYDAIAQATNWVNEFLELILPDESKKTVLDRFNEVEIDTTDKLEQIKSTAEEARMLTEQLEKINQAKIGETGTDVQKFVDNLSKIDLNGEKIEIVKSFISTLASDSAILTGLTGESAEGAKQWLEGIAAAADKLDPNDAEGWKTLMASIKEGLPGLENTDFGKSFFSALGEGFEDVSSSTSVLDWVIDNLGANTERTAEQQEQWLDICKQLVKTIPGLSSMINTQTGEITGGTQAVKDYIKAWEEGQTKLAYLQMHEEKASLLEQEFADLKHLRFEADMAGWRIERKLGNVKAIYDKYGLDYAFDQKGNLDLSEFNNIWGGITDAERSALNQAKADIENSGLGEAYIKALDVYRIRQEAYDLATEMMNDEEKMINDMAGDAQQKTVETVKEWSEDMKDAARTVVNAAQEALTSLADYVQGVRDGVAKAVDGVVKGFEQVERSGSELRQKNSDLEDEFKKTQTDYSKDKNIRQRWWDDRGNLDLQRMSDHYDELNKSEKEAYNTLAKIKNKQTEINESLNEFGTSGMKSNLQGQIQYMDEYLENLKQLQEWGLSNELLAFLSDGSTESAEYLAGLVAGGETAAKEVDAAYGEVQKKKKEFTDTLTEQQLTIDDTYKTLQEDAKAAVEALNMADMAKENSGKTVEGVAQGIADHLPEVQAAVDDIITQINRLAGLNVSVGIGSFGVAPPGSTSGKTFDIDGMFETGLNYVPFTGFLASLHEGEGILTAEENRIWQKFKDGGNVGTDYDTLGGVMRDNIHAGGNVYLDGRVVGSVISDQQGKSFRQLQRSGWQA